MRLDDVDDLDLLLDCVKRITTSDGLLSYSLEYIAHTLPIDLDTLRAVYPDKSALFEAMERRHRVLLDEAFGADFDEDDFLDWAYLVTWRAGRGEHFMDAMAAIGQVNLEALTAFYGDNNRLFVFARRRYDAKIRETLLGEIEAFASRHGPREGIRQTFQRLQKDIAESNADYWYPLLTDLMERGWEDNLFFTSSALELATVDDWVVAVALHTQEELRALFGRIVDTGKAQGEIAPSIDTASVAEDLMYTLIDLMKDSCGPRATPEERQEIIDTALRRLG